MEHLKLPPEDINSLSIGNAFEIHRIHNAEDIIVPKGISKGYPLNINFDIVYQRVKKLIPEWKKLLTKTRPSSFLDTALKERHEIGKLINPNIAYYRYKINVISQI
ncbi:MAG TPA: hypothetical protein VJ697_08160 [Nitrososphaeraceae archaeon]|nr:hypothetical protein [Nitrososphaeraceae archaeon]